eukprot:TRINITY_DN18519_c0_g1_i1.p1 TRINITY_DN18519_c0_g1~~TRINITY_DN18519_c0_g1_i1.p1  ORF type:complete len:249 (+),score=67.81 TRINITY_DN18519_c0_g1_i1:136-882(+)
MIRRPPRSTLSSSSAASDVYKRQYQRRVRGVLLGMAWLLVLVLCCMANAQIPQELLDKFATPERDPHGLEFDNAQPRNRYHQRHLDQHGHADLHFLAQDWIEAKHEQCHRTGDDCLRPHAELHNALDRDMDGEVTPKELYSLSIGLGFPLGNTPIEQHARLGHAYRLIKAHRDLREHQPGVGMEDLATMDLRDSKHWVEKHLGLSNRWGAKDHRPAEAVSTLKRFFTKVQNAEYNNAEHTVDGERYDL